MSGAVTTPTDTTPFTQYLHTYSTKAPTKAPCKPPCELEGIQRVFVNMIADDLLSRHLNPTVKPQQPLELSLDDEGRKSPGNVIIGCCPIAGIRRAATLEAAEATIHACQPSCYFAFSTLSFVRTSSIVLDFSRLLCDKLAALDCGFDTFDTAPHYALGVSEQRLGSALRTYKKPLKHVRIWTKGTPPI